MDHGDPIISLDNWEIAYFYFRLFLKMNLPTRANTIFPQEKDMYGNQKLEAEYLQPNLEWQSDLIWPSGNTVLNHTRFS